MASSVDSKTKVHSDHCSVVYDPNPMLGSMPVGKLIFETEGALSASIVVRTANVSRDAIQTTLDQVSSLDPRSRQALIGRVSWLAQKEGVHLLDLPDLVMEAGISSTHPDIRGRFQGLRAQKLERERLRREESERCEASRRQQELALWESREFDGRRLAKDALYFEYVSIPMNQMKSDPRMSRFRSMHDNGQMHSMWDAIPRALWFQNHPHHARCVECLRAIAKGNISHEEAKEKWGKLGDDMYYLFHHGDLADCVVERALSEPVPIQKGEGTAPVSVDDLSSDSEISDVDSDSDLSSDSEISDVDSEYGSEGAEWEAESEFSEMDLEDIEEPVEPPIYHQPPARKKSAFNLFIDRILNWIRSHR